MKPVVNIIVKDVLSKVALEVGNGRTSIAISIQICVALAHIRQETLSSDLYEGVTTVQEDSVRV